jgi:outer membrane receptor protein involved in Fe transport
MYKLLVFLFCSSFAMAQVPTTATLVGRVADATGAAVPDASIRVVNSRTNSVREVRTDSSGNYTVSSLPAPGIYNVTAEKAGFRQVTENGLELQVDQEARLDLSLQIGTIQTTVEVIAPMPVLDTENGTKGEVVTNKEINEVPISSMNEYDLMVTVAGVNQYKTTTGTAASGTGYSIDGARPTGNSVLISGVDVTGYAAQGTATGVGLDAIQEFKVVTNSFSAEYGRRGGGVITMAITQGGNALHGGLTENFRNNDLNARNFFAPTVGSLHWNDFGGSIGGPVVLPKIYNGRDRTFFFFDDEYNHEITDNTDLDIVPTALERTGNFSASKTAAGAPVYLKDPLASGTCSATSAAACFPGNIIPANRLDPVAQKLMQLYPLPNASGANNYVIELPWHQYTNPVTARIDQRISPKNWLSAMAVGMWIQTHDPFAYTSSPIGNFPVNYNGFGPFLSLNLTSTLTPSVVNVAQGGYMRNNGKMALLDSTQNYLTSLGMAGVNVDPSYYGYPHIQITGETAIGDNNSDPSITNENNYSFSDTLTWVKNNHTLKFGFQAYRNQYKKPYTANERGNYVFNGGWSSSALGDFELGYLNYTTKLQQIEPSYTTASSYNVFVQDDWKVSPTVTINLGLRYELPLAAVAQEGRLGSFIPSLDEIAIGSAASLPNLTQLLAAANLTGKVVLASSVGLPESLTHTPTDEFAPRFGIAWRPFKRTVIRSGAGLFYTGDAFSAVQSDLSAVYPFVNLQQFNKTSVPTALTLDNPIPTSGAAVANSSTAYGYQANPAPSYLTSWNVTAEEDLGGGMLLSLAYAGSKGTHLGRLVNINQPAPSPTIVYPYTGYGVINYFEFGSNSSYNSGTATLLKRFASNVFVRVNYTYSKCIDYQSQINGAAAGNYNGAQNSNDLAAERGRCDWDQGHVVAFNFIYQTPRQFGRFGRGWQLAGTGFMATGKPFTPQLGTTTVNLGQPNRPNRIAKGTLADPTVQDWFNLSAFTPLTSTSYVFGNSGRNILDGPGYASLDLALSKWFHFRERYSAQVRFEAYNSTNRANFGQPSVNVDQVGVGTITSAYPSRAVQLGARFRF